MEKERRKERKVIQKNERGRREKEYVSFYAVISTGTGAFDITADISFFVLFLSRSYISSRANVGTKPRATHNVDSSISIASFGWFYYISSSHFHVELFMIHYDKSHSRIRVVLLSRPGTKMCDLAYSFYKNRRHFPSH